MKGISDLCFFPYPEQAVLVNPGKVRVSDVGSDVIEELDFSGSRVVEMSLGFGYLLAATHNQASPLHPRRFYFAQQQNRTKIVSETTSGTMETISLSATCVFIGLDRVLVLCLCIES